MLQFIDDYYDSDGYKNSDHEQRDSSKSRRVPASQFRPQQNVDPLAVALTNISPGAAMDGSAATFLDNPIEISDPMDLDDLSEMKSIKVDDPMDVDPQAFAISVMVTGRRPYAIWPQAQYHRI